jgi:hypothetical protein
MVLETSTLKPGLLVSLKTSVTGNVSYIKRDIETDHVTEDGHLAAKWETERTIVDPGEHEAAIKVRSKARALVTGSCVASAFGLLCPESGAGNLELAIAEARRLTDAFNAEARLTRVSVYVIAGRVAANDVEATKAINSEVRDLLEDMRAGIANLDVGVIRAAANKARAIGAMLAPDASERVRVAIETARSVARKIVQAGETAAQEVDHQAIRAIAEARTQFLDIDTSATIMMDAAADEARAVDFAPADDERDPDEEHASYERNNLADLEVEPLTPIEIDEIGGDIKETMIEQQVTGLRLMPQMLPRVEEMAARGDETAAEVVRRFKNVAAPVPQIELD